MNLPAIIRNAEGSFFQKLGVMDGIVVFLAATCLFRASQDFQEVYFYPDDNKKSLALSAAIGFGLLLWRGKDLLTIVE
jgi:hypothetical protein